MYRLENSRTETITPDRALKLLELNTFGGQRKLNKDWVQNLASCMNDQTFIKGSIATAVNCKSNVPVLMNGQHQLEACVMSGRRFVASVDEYAVDSDTDMWHLFALFDTHKSRSESQVMKAARGLFESRDLSEVPLSILSSCGSALLFLGGGTKPRFSAKPTKKSDKADLVRKYERDVLEVASYGLPRINVPVVTAIISTYRKRPDLSQKFFWNVLHGTDLKDGSPQHKLNTDLNKYYSRNRGGGMRNHEVYRLCICWWNTWIKGDDRQFVRLSSSAGGSVKEIPDVIG